MTWDKIAAAGKSKKNDSELLSANDDVINDEMGVLPSVDENERFEKMFSKQSRQRERSDGYVVSDSGPTFVGKTFRGLSLIKQNPKGIEEEVPTWKLKSADQDFVIEAMKKALKEKRYHTVDKLFVFGTEVSTIETLNSEDNTKFFENWYDKIFVLDMYKKEESNDALNVGVDAVGSIKELTKCMILLERELNEERKKIAAMERANRAQLKSEKIAEKIDDRIKETNKALRKLDVVNRGILFDSATSIFMWHNEVIRRKLMKIKLLAKSQAVPPQFWFWRNQRMESLGLDFRHFNIPVWLTWKMSKDKDGAMIEDKPKWHDDTSGHLSSIWINSRVTGDAFVTDVMKCRPRKDLVGNSYPWMTANLLLALCLGLGDKLKPRLAFTENARKSADGGSFEEV